LTPAPQGSLSHCVRTSRMPSRTEPCYQQGQAVQLRPVRSRYKVLPMAKSARQVRVEKERLAAACDNIRLGLHLTQAYELADLAPQTVSDWRKWAAKGREPYIGYIGLIEKAEAQAEQVLLAKIQRAASDGTWTAAAWILERRWSDRWKKPEFMQHSGDMTLKVIWENGNGNGGKPHAK